MAIDSLYERGGQSSGSRWAEPSGRISPRELDAGDEVEFGLTDMATNREAIPTPNDERIWALVTVLAPAPRFDSERMTLAWCQRGPVQCGERIREAVEYRGVS